MLPMSSDVFRLSTDNLFALWEKQAPEGVDEEHKDDAEDDREAALEVKP